MNLNLNNVKEIEFLGTCSDPVIAKKAEWISDGRKADKKKVHKLIKHFYPEIYNRLGLNYYNPYSYYARGNYLNLVHSMIDYIFLITYKEN